jgi:hypothetical protein
LEVTDTSVEPQTTVNEQNEINSENKEEQIEPIIASINDEDVPLPGLDLNTEDNEKKRKRTPSQVNRIFEIDNCFLMMNV